MIVYIINYVTFHLMTCCLQCSSLRQNCIRIGVTIFKIFIYGQNHILQLHSPLIVKLNFRPYMYIQRYTSQNKNFDYSYPLIYLIRREAAQTCYLYTMYIWIYVIAYFIYTGQAYNLEKQSEPGISVDLDSTLASMDTLEFCLVRENSKSFTVYIHEVCK